MTTRRTKKKKKTRIFSICLIIIALLLIVGCGLYILKDKLVNTTETPNSPVVSTEVKNQSDDASAGTSSDENAEIKEDLFGLFLDGKIDAESTLEEGVEEPINASTLDLEGDEWDSYHFYDYRDVNNDGDAELMLSGPYGYSFFDIRDNKVILFEDGLGTGATCLLAYYKDAYWIVQAHAWEDSDDFSMHRYEGSTLAETLRFGSDADENDEKYFYRSLPNSDDIEKISEAEYNELIDSILQD